MSSEDKLFRPKNAPKPPATARRKSEPTPVKKTAPVEKAAPVKKSTSATSTKKTAPIKKVASVEKTVQVKKTTAKTPLKKIPKEETKKAPATAKKPVEKQKPIEKKKAKPVEKNPVKEKKPTKPLSTKKDKAKTSKVNKETKNFESPESKLMTKKEVIKEKKEQETFVSSVAKKIPGFKKEEINSVQNFLPFHKIYEGMIVTTDHKFIGILEINGVDFIKATHKEDILNRFGSLFNAPSVRISIKILTNSPNPHSQIKAIYHRKDYSIYPIQADVERKIVSLSNGGTYERRYFIVYEYLGDEKGVKDKNEEKVASQMKVSRSTISTQLSNMGVEVINTNPDNDTIGEILYSFFNRRSMYSQTYEERKAEVIENTEIFNQSLGKKVPVRVADLVAPRGLDLSHKDYMIMDGVYYTYLTLKTETWPQAAKGPWLTQFDKFGAFLDIDIVTKALPNETVRVLLQKRNQVLNQFMQYNASSVKLGAEDKQRRMAATYQNTRIITDSLERGECIYNVLVIFTLKAMTKKVLFEKRAELKQFLNSTLGGIKASDSYLENDEFFKQTLPVGYTSKIFNRYSHNLTTEGISTLFAFTQHRLCDPKGVVLGYSSLGALAAVDIFNTKKYPNANLAIFGSSGGGKTFTQSLLAEGLFLQGKRLWFILPKKGYEYLRGCERLGGNYIQLSPGSDTCINICAIIPRVEDPKRGKESWRADKITSLTVWINLLLGEKERLTIDETTRLTTILAKFYHKYDIEEDNKSLFEEDGSLKPMPTLSDLYAFIAQQGDLDRVAQLLRMCVKGNYACLNGQTNIDTSSEYVVFDVNEELIPEDHLAAFLYIAFDYVTQHVKSNFKKLDVLVMDEYWRMLQSPECANQVKDCLKIFRGYGGSVILATQELKDCLSSDEGRSVVNNTSMKLCLKTSPLELELVQKATGISDAEAEKLIGLKHQGMFITDKERTIIKIEASKEEFEAFNTDITQELEDE